MIIVAVAICNLATQANSYRSPNPPHQVFYVNFVYIKHKNMGFPKGIMPFGGEFERQSLSNWNDMMLSHL